MRHMMFGFMEGIVGILAISLAVYLVLAFVLVYFAADGQSRRSGARDPMLGARVATTFLLTLCLQLGLAGATVFLASAFEGAGEGLTRIGLGVLLGCAVAGAFPLVILRTRLNPGSGAATDYVGRKAVGVNAIVVGAGATALVIAVVSSLVAGADLQLSLLAGLLVYGGATVALFLPLAKAPTAAA